MRKRAEWMVLGTVLTLAIGFGLLGWRGLAGVTLVAGGVLEAGLWMDRRGRSGTAAREESEAADGDQAELPGEAGSAE